jgi:hypothetical protein
MSAASNTLRIACASARSCSTSFMPVLSAVVDVVVATVSRNRTGTLCLRRASFLHGGAASLGQYDGRFSLRAVRVHSADRPFFACR